MINITVSVQRRFTLPANRTATIDYLRDLPRTLEDLPRLALVRTHAPNQYRIVYRAADAGVYRVAPVPFRHTMNSLTGQGYYSSQAVLQPAGASTDVTYDVQISAQIPKRPALALVPDTVVQRAVETVVQQRLRET